MDKLVAVVFFIGLVVLFSAGFAWVQWSIWQAVCVPVFGWPSLTFGQAWALSILLGLACGAVRSSSK